VKHTESVECADDVAGTGAKGSLVEAVFLEPIHLGGTDVSAASPRLEGPRRLSNSSPDSILEGGASARYERGKAAPVGMPTGAKSPAHCRSQLTV
jgi:hypothetical protein